MTFSPCPHRLLGSGTMTVLVVMMLAGCGSSGSPDPAVLEVEIHPPHPTITAYGQGPSLIVGEVLTDEDARVALAVSVEPPIDATVQPVEGVGSRVFEIWLRPTMADVGKRFVLDVRATSGGSNATDSVEGEVFHWPDDDTFYPDELLSGFLAYIESNHPQMALRADTPRIESWNPEPMIIVVNHRAYLFEDWVLHLAWHVTIPPDDWAILSARRRDRLDPEIAFCLPSQQEDRTVRDADVSDPRRSCTEGI